MEAMSTTCSTWWLLEHENDTKLILFYSNWINAILCLSEPLLDKTYEFILYKQLKTSPGLKDAIGRYDRAKPKSSKKSYAYLKRQLERHLAHEKKDRTRHDIEVALNGETPLT